MHMSFKIHYRNNLIDKKDSYLISCPPSWDDHNYSYGHQLYPSGVSGSMLTVFLYKAVSEINLTYFILEKKLKVAQILMFFFL